MAKVFVMIFTKVLKETDFDAKAFDTRKKKFDLFDNFEEKLSHLYISMEKLDCLPPNLLSAQLGGRYQKMHACPCRVRDP